MSQVFISYSSADRDWAKTLERKLKPYLLPYRDDSRLVVARPFQNQLFEKLDESAALLIIWSKRVRDMQGEWKEWVRWERIGQAIQ